jgi:GNAT superfamily N-acetyltransferase
VKPEPRYTSASAAIHSAACATSDATPDAVAATVRLRELTKASESELRALAELLIDCVDGGASVSFMSPLLPDRALAFWRRAADAAANGERVLLVAEDDGGILGTVQVVLDQPENQPHRADVSKMLVRRHARRRGIGESLMRAAEAAALAHGKNVLVLDTATPEAERLYERCGWTRCGVIPKYALLPQGGFCDTTYFYRVLS